MLETPSPPSNGVRWILSTRKTLFTAFLMMFLFTVFYWQRDSAPAALLVFRQAFPPPRQLPLLRPVAFNLTDFGGVGDGATVNTAAFERAVMAISKHGKKGGAQLNVPPGNWLTAPFNLTSHMTLFLAEGAVILGIDAMYLNQGNDQITTLKEIFVFIYISVYSTIDLGENKVVLLLGSSLQHDLCSHLHTDYLG